jgi:hypothetical protein
MKQTLENEWAKEADRPWSETSLAAFEEKMLGMRRIDYMKSA